MVYFPIENGKEQKGGREKEREREGEKGERYAETAARAMMEPSVHRDPRIINIDDLRPLFGPDGTPLLRAIAPVYEPSGRSAASFSLSLSLRFPLFMYRC